MWNVVMFWYTGQEFASDFGRKTEEISTIPSKNWTSKLYENDLR